METTGGSKKFLDNFKFIRSFRLRIFLIIAVISVTVCLILRSVFLSGFYTHSIESKENEIKSQMTILANQILTHNYLQDNSSEVVNAELTQIATLYKGRVLVINSGFEIISDTYGTSVGKYDISQDVLQCFQGSTVGRLDKERELLTIAVPICDNNQNLILGVLLIHASIADFQDSFAYYNREMWIVIIVILLLVLSISFAFCSVIVRPFTRISQEINHIVSFDDESVVVSDYLETEEIVDSFNKLKNRLKILDDSRQEFVSNVSHELKTPLTSIKVLADSLNVQEGAPIEMYQEFMQDIAEEVDRENKIISDLLALVKMDQGATGLNLESRDMNEMIEAILKRLGPIARKNEVDLIFESCRSVVADVDEVKLSLALTNLIENGIKYNKHPGWVKVILDADHQYMTIDVVDCGLGIPEDAIEHIFERFYRVDKSHSKEIGGTGLGLAITRKTILLHRGSIQVKSKINEGTTFTVKIPLSYIM